MILFQAIVVPLVLALLVRSIRNFIQGRQSRSVTVLAVAIWSATGLAILWPEVTVRAAAILGIGRGTDLVVYIFVIAFLLACFYFYTKVLKLESDITELVRYLAVRDVVDRAADAKRPSSLKELVGTKTRDELNNEADPH